MTKLEQTAWVLGLLAFYTGTAVAGPIERPDARKSGDASTKQTRILERTDGRTHGPSGLLEAPAALARWLNKQGRRQVAVSIEIGR